MVIYLCIHGCLVAEKSKKEQPAFGLEEEEEGENL